MYTGHHRTLAIESNDILMDQTDQGMTRKKDGNKFIAVLKKILYETRLKNNVMMVLNF